MLMMPANDQRGMVSAPGSLTHLSVAMSCHRHSRHYRCSKQMVR